MKFKRKDFEVSQGEKARLDRRPTRGKPCCKSKDEYRTLLAKHIEKLSEMQNLLYAYDRYALLLIFQAMDAAGKDSAIKHVMSGVNPQGCQVFGFEQPSAEELQHDFLWRSSCRLPERGRIGIFNRSYYEEVLVARVRPRILRAEKLSDELLGKKAIWRQRYHSIVEMEKHLHRNGTRIIKFFLHVSKEEQRRRLLRRIDDPDKNWKFSLADLEERKLWKKYLRAYDDCLSATSTREAPWYVIPADDKENARLMISQVIVDTLADMKMSYPRPDAQRLKELKAIRKLLAK